MNELPRAKVEATEQVQSDPQVRLRCWGTRGSIPAPGPGTVRYGGNTACLELVYGESSYIFDAGSGLRLLGEREINAPGPVDTTVFLTHFHWDHIQGFPFFRPLYEPDTVLRIIGPPQDGLGVQQLFAGQMGPIYFPVPFHAVEAELSFFDLKGGPWSDGIIDVLALPVRHESLTLGYRADLGGRRIVFVPDNELVGGAHVTPDGWRNDMVDLVRGANLLIHDAVLTDEEYMKQEGWGHSTFRQAIDLAIEGEVEKLLFFHHAPERSDDAIDQIVEEARGWVADSGASLKVDAAREGVDLTL